MGEMGGAPWEKEMVVKVKKTHRRHDAGRRPDEAAPDADVQLRRQDCVYGLPEPLGDDVLGRLLYCKLEVGRGRRRRSGGGGGSSSGGTNSRGPGL